uniref:Secreted protein n=1 Tax=Steinernema glaseri TaxID=37863 RepID=A0A1I7Z4Y2_9BILA
MNARGSFEFCRLCIDLLLAKDLDVRMSTKEEPACSKMRIKSWTNTSVLPLRTVEAQDTATYLTSSKGHCALAYKTPLKRCLSQLWHLALRLHFYRRPIH